jgi:hypothetical protein
MEIRNGVSRVGMPSRRSSQYARRAYGALMLVATLAAAALVVAVSAGAAPSRTGTASAHEASTISLNETGRLHLISKHGFTLNEQGAASGTIGGTITVHLKIVSTSRVTAEVTIAPKGGSISGSGTASYHKGENGASFAGGLSISRRSGSYANARGLGLKFSGTIARSNDAITVHVNGRLTD